MNHIHHHMTILFVESQDISTNFYKDLFRFEPTLNVPGMTEFQLSEHSSLGLMPNNGIAKILESRTPHPSEGFGIPRCELYMVVENVTREFHHAKQCNAKVISPPMIRSWGDIVFYLTDPDGHIIAFAEKQKG